ncbi:hypothetical protein [Nonomuraea fuscirosea]|uniref:hypothetical protein n=1 Tax=Nonomuraea fuscirosea TaxID=1291556 RepID=UPI0033C08E66
MPVMDGVAATERIVTELPQVKVLALSTFDLEEQSWPRCGQERRVPCPRTSGWRS